MSQTDVYQYLKERRLAGDDAYYTVKEITCALRERGLTNGSLSGVRGDLTKLTIAGYLDTMKARDLLEWPGRFRLKRKYTKLF